MLDQTSTTTEPERWFALIGIDFYIPGTKRIDKQGNPLNFPNLRGCVNDVREMRQYIETQLNIDPSRILELTSAESSDGKGVPREEESSWPTRDNIIKLFEKLISDATAGDLVFIQYSGHGTRVKTSYSNLKGEAGFDEAIVPLDIQRNGQYLLDIELAVLLDRMVQKGLIVTIVLDCCHSGGATRDGDGTAVCRGISGIDASGSLDEGRKIIQVSDNQQDLQGFLRKSYRKVDRQLWWEPRGYEMLAACRLNEKANEDYFEGHDHYHGALAYNLLLSLKSGGPGLTHGMVYQRLSVKVNHDFPNQTPVFAGNRERYFFKSSDKIANAHSFAITRVKGRKITFGAGKAHGIMVGSEFAIYPWNAENLNDSSQCKTAKVIQVDQVESIALLDSSKTPIGEIELGSQVVPVKSLVQKLRLKFFPSPSGSTEIPQFQQLRDEINRNAQDSPVELIFTSDSAAQYHIGVGDGGGMKLLDTANKPVANFPQSSDPKLFLSKLGHLARYDMFREVKNLTHTSLEGKFDFELLLGGSQAAPSPPQQIHRVKEMTTITVRFTNNSGVPLNITIFNFGPLWDIDKVAPEDQDYDTVPDKEFRDYEYEMYLPENWDLGSSEYVDCFKAFVTTTPTQFNSLVLPELGPDSQRWEPNSTRGGEDLDTLLADLGFRRATLVRSSAGIGKWATAKIEIHIVPNEDRIGGGTIGAETAPKSEKVHNYDNFNSSANIPSTGEPDQSTHTPTGALEPPPTSTPPLLHPRSPADVDPARIPRYLFISMLLALALAVLLHTMFDFDWRGSGEV